MAFLKNSYSSSLLASQTDFWIPPESAFKICEVQIPKQCFVRLKTKQEKQIRIHRKTSVPLAWVLKIVKFLIYFKTII